MSWLPPAVTVEPASEPVSNAEARSQCHIDSSDFDTELTIYIKTARQLVEEYTGTKLVSQTCVLRCSSFADFASLPTAPVSAVSEIKYLDTSGVEQTLSTDVYETVLIGLEPHIRLKINQSWPSIRNASDAIRVTCVAGYSTVPEPIRASMLLLIGQWFENRSAINVGNIVNDLPFSVNALLSNYRRF